MPSLSALQAVLNGAGLHFDLVLWLGLGFLVFARITAAVVFAPFLGGNSVPGRIKAGIAFVLSGAILPVMVGKGAVLPASGLLFLALIFKEVVVGLVIGFLSQLVFFAVQMAGTIVDTQRGLNQISFLAPQLEGHASAFGALQFQAALVIFFAMQGHLMFIGALMESFRKLPLLALPQMAGGIQPLAEQAARVSGDALLLACQIAAPVVLAIFLVDVAFASAARVAGQIQISHDAFTAKSLVGLALVCFLTAAFLDQLQPAFAAMLRNITRFVEAMR